LTIHFFFGAVNHYKTVGIENGLDMRFGNVISYNFFKNLG
jgi:hypothetical protein